MMGMPITCRTTDHDNYQSLLLEERMMRGAARCQNPSESKAEADKDAAAERGSKA